MISKARNAFKAGNHTCNLHVDGFVIGKRRVTLSETRARACVCVCVCKIGPISARTLSFRHQTCRKIFSHSNFSIPSLWTAFCVPLSFVFFTKNNNLECRDVLKTVTVTTINCKQQQPLTSVIQWYSARLRSWRSEFKPHTSSPHFFNTLLFAINNVYF